MLFGSERGIMAAQPSPVCPACRRRKCFAVVYSEACKACVGHEGPAAMMLIPVAAYTKLCLLAKLRWKRGVLKAKCQIMPDMTSALDAASFD